MTIKVGDRFKLDKEFVATDMWGTVIAVHWLGIVLTVTDNTPSHSSNEGQILLQDVDDPDDPLGIWVTPEEITANMSPMSSK